MKTHLLRLDMRSKAAKALKELITEMSKNHKGIELEESSPYDSEFVSMVKKAAASKKRTVVDPDNLWESIK